MYTLQQRQHIFIYIYAAACLHIKEYSDKYGNSLCLQLYGWTNTAEGASQESIMVLKRHPFGNIVQSGSRTFAA